MRRGDGSWLQRHMPNLAVLLKYQRSWLRGDLIAGCTVAAYLVPQVMAYATIAGLPAAVGLWAILPALTAYAVFGTSRQLSIGPESTTALMTAAVVGPLANGSATRYATLSAALAIMVGLLCLVCWVLRLGFIADLLSRPVLVGYLAGIAMIMVAGQLSRLTGVPVSGESFLEQLASLAANLWQFHSGTLLMGAVVVAFLFIVQWRWEHAPAALLAVFLATAAVFLFGLERYGIKVVGVMSMSLPQPGLPSIGDFGMLLLPAVGVLLVGYTDNMLTARSFAGRQGEQIDANQELLALGLSNVGAGGVGGFPISSSPSRPALAAASGGKTQLYSLVAVLWTLAVLLFFGPVLAHFPTVVLGAIVVFAAAKLVEVREFRRLAAFRRRELLIALGALFGVLAFGILYGVLLAVVLSVAEMLQRVARPHDAILGFVPDLAGMHDIDDYPSARTIPGLVVYRYDSPLFFANAGDFRRRALDAVAEGEVPVAWFVLNMEANVEVDITALDALESVRYELETRGVVLALTRVKHDLYLSLEAFGLVQSVGPDRIFPTLPTAVAAYQQWVRQGDATG